MASLGGAAWLGHLQPYAVVHEPQFEDHGTALCWRRSAASAVSASVLLLTTTSKGSRSACFPQTPGTT